MTLEATLIDASAAFGSGALPEARTRAVARMGITRQIVCGCDGPAPDTDVEITSLNRRRRVTARANAGGAAWCAAADARRPDHARDQIVRASTRGAVGIDLFTAGAGETALDAVVNEAARRGLPVRLSSAGVLADLLRAHPRAQFVLSRPGDDPYGADDLAPLADAANVHLDLASCGAVRGALDAALALFGAARLLWGSGAQLATGLAQLRALDVIAPGAEVLDALRWRNAERLYARLGASP